MALAGDPAREIAGLGVTFSLAKGEANAASRACLIEASSSRSA